MRLFGGVLLGVTLALIVLPVTGGEAAPVQDTGLVEEIMLLEVRLQRARQEAVDLDRQAADLEEEITRTRAEMASLTQELEARRRDLGLWLRYRYQYGPASYLAVLLQATSFTDFLTREQLLTFLARHGLGLLAETEHLLARQEDNENRISQRMAEINQKRGEAERTLVRIETLLDEKNQALARARAAGDTTAVEVGARWENDLPNLHYLLRNFSRLPWKVVEPQAVEIDYRLLQARATVTAEGLTRAMSADPQLKNFQVGIEPTQVIIEGHDPDFRLSGRAAARNNRIYLTPQQLTWSDLQVGEQVLRELTGGYELYFTFPEVIPGIKLRSLEQRQGYFLLTLGF